MALISFNLKEEMAPQSDPIWIISSKIAPFLWQYSMPNLLKISRQMTKLSIQALYSEPSVCMADGETDGQTVMAILT